MKRVITPLVLFVAVGFSSYINFLLFGLSNIGGNPYDYMSLAALVVGILGFSIYVLTHAKKWQFVGLIGMVLGVLNAALS